MKHVDPKIMTPRSIKTYEGMTVLFKCITNPVVKWTFNYNRRLPANAHLQNSTLVIEIVNISRVNQGVYECTGYSMFGLPFYSHGELYIVGKNNK